MSGSVASRCPAGPSNRGAREPVRSGDAGVPSQLKFFELAQLRPLLFAVRERI